MNLKAIELPHSVISSLYTTNLIEGESITAIEKTGVAEAEIHPEDEFRYFGNNEKKILIVVNSQDLDYLQDEDMAFLTNMLTACKLSIKDVAIFNIGNLKNFSYREIVKRLETRVVLLINTEASSIGLPLDFPYFQVQPFSNMTFLSSPSLSDIKGDPLQKSKLWVCLRRIFNV